MFLASLITLSVAAAESTTTENTLSDTAWQHHLWSQKFDTMTDPEVTRSIASQARFGNRHETPRMRPNRTDVQRSPSCGLAVRVLLITMHRRRSRNALQSFST